jgi:hypothetical protein
MKIWYYGYVLVRVANRYEIYDEDGNLKCISKVEGWDNLKSLVKQIALA